jgi:hypothetical protein
MMSAVSAVVTGDILPSRHIGIKGPASGPITQEPGLDVTRIEDSTE